jgi:predicted dehydrogenase
MQPIRIGLVGLGKIARDQHVPWITANPAFVLTAVASRHAQLPGAANFPSIEAMLDGVPELDAVAICTPPRAHYPAARLALSRGKHVLLEKPPCASVAELEYLAQLAASCDRTLFATWHSRHAAAVEATEAALRERILRRARVTWVEDVRQWHPGQAWLREAGGFGVFDAAINALSILTRVIPEPIFVRSALLHVPENWATPIAAEVELESGRGANISARLDFRYRGQPKWEIDFLADGQSLQLVHGGAALSIDGTPVTTPGAALESEYAAIYRRFEQLIFCGESDVDARPLQCVADTYLIARHIAAEAFEY